MMKTKFIILFVFSFSFLFGQNKASDKLISIDTETHVKYRNSVGASFFMLGNFLEESPDYVLFTYGYRLTKKDRVFAEFNTWKYAEPLGTYNKSEEFYPGFVRASGIGFGYQRFHWRGLFTTIQATSFMKQYFDTNEEKTQKGFQLYLQLAAGYRFQFFKERFYVEPAIALKYWPVDTNLPDDVAVIEEGKPKYIFEPSLNFGFRF